MTEWHPDIPVEYRNQIVTGDARVLAERIPDASVDLIFTDPVYDRIDDYKWLAETAARVLKPDSAALVFCGIGYLPETLDALRGSGLDYRWTLGGRIQSAASYGFIGKMIPKYKMAIWMDKGRARMFGYTFDMAILPMAHSRILESKNHEWNKHTDLIAQWLCAFCDVRTTVYDPFTGGGTVPAVCKMLGRNYIASEIDPDTAERARERVLMTQPPLFVHTEEQAELWA